MSTKTLVIGAPGWLGSSLVRALVDPDHELNKYSSIKDRKVRCLVLPHIAPFVFKDIEVEVVPGDIRDINSLHQAMQGVDTVFHCAGLIHPKKIKDLYEINTKGTQNVLRAAIKAGVRKVVYVSSNSVAGCNVNPNKLFTEDDPPHPYKHYGKSKLLAEKAVQEAQQSGEIQTVIIRPCWFYGPGQPARQTRFFKMIMTGRPLIFGNGQNLRSMSYIDNTIQGLLLAESSEKANGQIYWIADERPYKTIEIYKTVADLLGVKEFKPRFLPSFASWGCERIDDILQSMGRYIAEFHVAGEMNKNIACSVEKAKKELGYQPTVSLKEGMRRSIEWCYKYNLFG